jgi:hypothetical protein
MRYDENDALLDRGLLTIPESTPFGGQITVAFGVEGARRFQEVIPAAQLKPMRHLSTNRGIARALPCQCPDLHAIIKCAAY